MNLQKLKAFMFMFLIGCATASAAQSLPKTSLLPTMFNPVYMRKKITSGVFGKPALIAAQRNTLYARLMSWLSPKEENKKNNLAFSPALLFGMSQT